MQIMISRNNDLAFIPEKFQAGWCIPLTSIPVILRTETRNITQAYNHIAAFAFDLLHYPLQVGKILMYI
jgi:hypothetical protein